MKLLSKLAIFTFGISAVLVSSGAMAQYSASTSASITNIGYQLFDLDPTDGITPGITFSSLYNESASSFSSARDSDLNRTDSQTIASLDPISTSVTLGGVSASSAYSANGFSSSGQIGREGSYYSYGRTIYNFQLTPKTLLVYFGDVSETADRNATGSNYTGASVSAQIVELNSAGGFNQNSNFYRGVSLYGDLTSGRLDTTFVLSVINDNAVAINGFVYMQTYLDGTVSAVPEPETYAMMLGGLVLLSVLAKRRSHKSLS